MPSKSVRLTREGKCIGLPWAIMTAAWIFGYPVWSMIRLNAARLSNRPPPPPHSAIFEAGLLASGVGVLVIAMWFRRRPVRIVPGRVARCLACFYPAESSFGRCPECGADLQNSRAVVYGDPEPLNEGERLIFLLYGLGAAGYVLYRWIM